jgi:diacylglycerol kinase family enzyme
LLRHTLVESDRIIESTYDGEQAPLREVWVRRSRAKTDTSMASSPTDIDDMLRGRLVALLNTASGSFTASAPNQVRAICDDAGLTQAEVVCVAPSGLERALDQAVADCDVLVILGGDGTIRSAAEKCGRAGKALIPLPGGTMNMLPRALYGARGWRDALAATLADPEIHRISGGRAGAHAFYVAALVGAPTLWADAREALRKMQLMEAARRSMTAIRRSTGEPLDYAFDGRLSGSAEAVAVMCPLISKVMRENEPSLEAAAIDTHSTAEVLRLGINTLFNDWRDDPAVVRTKVRRVLVTGHGRVPVILDGERVRMGRTVDIEFVPQAFNAVVPSGSHGPAPA